MSVHLLLVTLAILLALMTLLPLSVRRDWWIRAMDFPRLQLATLSIIWFAVWLFWADRSLPELSIFAAVVLCVLFYQIAWIIPHTEIYPLEIQRYQPEFDGHAPTIKLLNCNVLMTNRDSEPLVTLVQQHEPDLLITLESDAWWQSQLDELPGYPYKVCCPLDNLYGMHLYSRLPLHETAIEYRVEQDKPSICARIEVTSSVSVHLHVVHPAPPAPLENDESTERDVELIMLARKLSNSPDRIIVAGDLNDVAWSATTRLFRQISGLLDPRVGRGLFNTFNAFHWFARWPLDHVFVSNHFRMVDIQCLPAIGSDHFPLMVELAITDASPIDNSVAHDEQDQQRLHSILDSSTAQSALEPETPASTRLTVAS